MFDIEINTIYLHSNDSVTVIDRTITLDTDPLFVTFAALDAYLTPGVIAIGQEIGACWHSTHITVWEVA